MAMRRTSRVGYVVLPSDEELLAIWKRHGYNQTSAAREIGCTPSAVGQRLRRITDTKSQDVRRINFTPPPDPAHKAQERVVELLAHIRGLEAHIQAQEKRIKELESRPKRVITQQNHVYEPDISHRRIADGGEPVRKQRKRRKQAQTTPTIVKIA